MSNWSAYLEQNRQRFLNDFLDLLRIPSVSTEPTLKPEVRRAATWTAERMQAAGIENVQVMETGGHPVVCGDWLHAPGQPTVLFYGHFDVQPADPLELWTSPPFEPVIKNGRVYARAASDMKGNMLLPVFACEAMLRTGGKLPVNVRFLLEGEEEIGSPSLPRFVAENQALLACDLMVSADSGQYSEEQPMHILAMRGLCGLQIDVRSAATDLHSGVMGGMVPNAIHSLVSLIATMRAPDGTIVVEGFHDDVLALTPADRVEIARVPDDSPAIQSHTGIKAFHGDPNFTPRERNWARPTLDVNGIWGGFQGAGIKTVIPAEAHAKITCRLVANQKPERVLEVLEAHIAKHAPKDVEVRVTRIQGQADPYLIPLDHFGIQAADRALTKLYGRAPYQMRFGATVPVTGIVLQILGVSTVQYGFGMMDELFHAPNEFTRIANFEKGQHAYALLMEELAK